MPVVRWIDHDGSTVETRCFNEYHAMRLQESLDAAGLPNVRVDRAAQGGK